MIQKFKLLEKAHRITLHYDKIQEYDDHSWENIEYEEDDISQEEFKEICDKYEGYDDNEIVRELMTLIKEFNER